MKKVLSRKRLVLTELHSGVLISNKEVAVKPFSFSLCKYPPWYKNINNHLESWFWKLSVDSLSCTSADFPVFPFFPRVFPLHLATLLVTVSSSSTLQWVIEIEKTKRVCNGLIFPGNHDPSSLTLGGAVVPLVCSFRRRDNLLAWRELFAILYELKSRIDFGRNTTTLRKFIGYINLTDFR